MSGGDIYVNVDGLKARSDRWQDHINAMEELIEEVLRGPIREAVRDGSRFGGFYQAKVLDNVHRQLAHELMWLLRQQLGGLRSGKFGLETTVKNYTSVDDQRSLEFAKIEKDMPGSG